MADIKINDLTAYTDPVSTDVLPIVDVGSDITKKVSIADLLENAGTGSAAAPSFSFDGDNNTGIYRPAADQVALTAGGTQALLAESTGITIPGNLTVSGTTTTVDTVNLTVKDKNIELGVVSTPSNTTADGGGITLKGATDKTITWVNSTGAWTFNQPTNFNDHVRIDSSGKLGIGTTSPAAIFHTKVATNKNIAFNLGPDSEARISCFNDAVSSSVPLGFNGIDLRFQIDGTERARIDSSGNVGIGTSSPAHNLDISPASGAAEVKIAGAEGQEASIRLYADQGDDAADIKKLLTDTSGNFKIQHYSGSAFVDSMVINSSGNATFTGDITKSTSSGSSVCIIRDDYLRIYDNPVSYDDYKITLEKTGSATFAGNVGIGTSVPNHKLHIHSTGNTPAYLRSTNDGTGTGTTDGIVIGMGDATNAYLWNYENGGIVFATNATQRAVIDSSGRVGIGTASPAAALEVTKASDMAVISATSGTNNSARFEVRSGNSTTSGKYAYIRFNNSDTNNQRYDIGTYGTDDLTFRDVKAASTRMTIDSSGRLLVGTSSYAGNGKLVTAGNTGGNAGTFDICWAGSRPTAANTDIGYIRWYSADNSSGNAHYASIYASSDGASSSGSDIPGRLMFSTTADGASSPTERMRISSNGGFDQFSNERFHVRSARTVANTGIFVCFSGASSISTGTEVFIVYANGDCKNTNNSFGAISDSKLKENIVDANSQWNDVKDLQVRNYNFKAETGFNTHTQIGLIAQEVETVSPGLVSESPDRDEEGTDLGTVTKSVNYSVLYMKAVKALQEAMDRIETLEQRLSDAGIA